MRLAPIEPASREMPFAVRPLEERDIPQSAAIEREAFPTLFPPTSFRRELRNRAARYLIAWRRDHPIEGEIDDGSDASEPRSAADASLLNRLLLNVGGLRKRRDERRGPSQFLTGFVGIWYMSNEAHIVSVGVKDDYRGKGIGELLLISAIEQAVIREATVVTLEVRVSNHAAKSLYAKYGFIERGIRKRYYTDNREDAAIMTTEPIQYRSFQEGFRDLIERHEQRWGHSRRRLF